MSTAPLLCLEQRGQVLELEPGSHEKELDEGPVLLTFYAPTRPVVQLDDLQLTTSWRSRELVAACNFDLTNQIGHHRLRVRLGARTYDFDFHTSTAKATRDEVLAMAELCGEHYFGYRRQFVYVASNGERRKVLLPQIHFAWLRDRIAEIEALTRSICTRPAVSSIQALRRSTRAKRVSLPGTIRLLHERPYFLEEHDDGPITIDGRRFWPAQIMEKVRHFETATYEHAAIARFLKQLLFDCRDLKGQLDTTSRADVDRLASTLENVVKLPLFAKAQKGAFVQSPHNAPPTQIERADGRYARMRVLRAEYLSDIGPSDDYSRSIRANVKDISEIYQTFVAHVVGNALELTYCSKNQNLRDRSNDGASMRSADWEFGFDAKPPGKMLTSWRGRTARPAGERPDISLVAATPERSILFDAKFKVAKVPAHAAQEDLFEMQGYLNSFSIPQGGIIYPGVSPDSTIIEAGGNRLVELPIRAEFLVRLGGKQGLHDYVRGAIESAVQPHAF